MILYVITATVSIGLGLLVDNHCKKMQSQYTRQQILNRLCLVSVFLLLFGVSALRLNVGNDYAKYVEFMHLIRCDAMVPTEFGFNAVVKFLYRISGFENYLLVFAVFAFVTIFLFMKAIYDQADSFGMSFFLFMTLGYYFQTFNTVRYYLALAVTLYAIPYVLRKEWTKFVLLILLGATMHKSLLVVLPLYFLASRCWKKWQLALAALFCTTFFFFQDIYLKIVVFLYPTYEDTEYLDGGTSVINVIRCLAVLILSLLCYQRSVKNHERNRFYFYCNLGALVMYVCCSFLPIISRIGYYLTITHIFFLPALIRDIENKKLRRGCLIIVIAAGILYFGILMVMKAGENGLRILPYQTFLFHEMVPILSDVS